MDLERWNAALKHDQYSMSLHGSTHLSDLDPPPHHHHRHLPLSTRIVDSFRKHPNAHPTPPAAIGTHGKIFDVDSAAHATATSPLQRHLKGRHLQMIAIGGSIGTGLFVGSGSSLATGGPASLLLGFSLIGAMLYCTVHALGEMAVLFPVAGSFSAFSTRFLDPAWGFAMGWKSVSSSFSSSPCR